MKVGLNGSKGKYACPHPSRDSTLTSGRHPYPSQPLLTSSVPPIPRPGSFYLVDRSTCTCTVRWQGRNSYLPDVGLGVKCFLELALDREGSTHVLVGRAQSPCAYATQGTVNRIGGRLCTGRDVGMGYFEFPMHTGYSLYSRCVYSAELKGHSRIADSVTWNPHKLMGTLLQCSTIHFKLDGLLLSCNQMSADYLFMQDKLYDIKYDTGDKVIQCGRHNDIFKLWLQFRAKGLNGFEAHMDHLMEMAEYLVERIRTEKDKFHLILEPECVNVSFWYIPKRLRTMPHNQNRIAELAKICPILKARMMEAGTMMVGYQPDDKRPNFFRSIFSSAAVQKDDVDFMLNEMDRLGQDL
ncbi:unnamed protein product [Nesidiocoris tenuis]|uniref:Glutamate decarboxylase n=1 Tax=Nesidiocoris tenuis TaxID=355587 RepID=A0A6H5G6A3_9HEMI|nr:unnamed protein product [Nesidiocoris tenuis]CAA9998348.1 unnamed protein product [Nesidiocoris tenuis]